MHDLPPWVPVAAGAFAFFVLIVGIALAYILLVMKGGRPDSKITGRGR